MVNRARAERLAPVQDEGPVPECLVVSCRLTDVATAEAADRSWHDCL